MKEKDIKSEPNKQTFVMYAEKEDGSYGTIESGSFLIENDLDDFWAKMEHMERNMRTKLENGEISVIQYFMVIEGLTPTELSSRAGIQLSRVKKHLTIQGFEKITIAELLKYCGVFNVPMANLFQIVLSSKDQNIKYHLYNKEEDSSEQHTITQDKTKNPFTVLTKVKELKK
jgi:hypothetical protein